LVESAGGSCSILIGKPLGKKALGKFRHRWEDNIRMDFREMRWEGVDWVHLAQDKDQWRALVYRGSIKGGIFLD
jgi:hypothetical protein